MKFKLLNRIKIFNLDQQNIIKNVEGKNNKIRIKSTGCSKVRFDINGDNNRISINSNCVLNNVLFYIKGSNCNINIGENVRFNNGGELWLADDDCTIEIGNNTTVQNAHIVANEPSIKVKLGEDCLLAYDIDIRSGDSHSIIDKASSNRINYGKDVNIGNHVWIAAHCSILKGVFIADNSIIATRSVVTKSFDKEGVIIGGNPGKIIKENISWERARIYDTNYEKQNK